MNKFNIAFYLALITVLSFYFYFNLVELIVFIFVLLVYGATHLSKIKTKSIVIHASAWKVGFVFFVSILITQNIASISHFYFLEIKPTVSISDYLINDNWKFLTTLLFGIIISSLYFVSAYSIGKKVIRNRIDGLDRIERALLEMIIGLGLWGVIIFFLSAWRILTQGIVISLILLSFLFLWNSNAFRKLNLSVFNKYIYKCIHYKASIWELILTVGGVVALLLVITLSVRSVPSGPDAFRWYMTTIKFINEYNGLLPTNIRSIYPYFAELILWLPYSLGGIAVGTIFLNSFTILSGLLIWKRLSWQQLTLKLKIVMLIVTLFGLCYTTFLINQYKIDPVLVCFVIATLYYFEKFLQAQTKSIDLLCILVFLIAISFLIKPQSLYFLSIIAVVIVIYGLKDVGLKKLVIPVLVGLIPLLIWTLFYRFYLPPIGDIGFGLANRELYSKPIPTMINSQCDTTMPMIEMSDWGIRYNWQHRIPDTIQWLFFHPTKRTHTPFNIYNISALGLIAFLFIIRYAKKIMHSLTKSEVYVTIALVLSWIPFLILTPGITWYLLPTFIYLGAVWFPKLALHSNILTTLLEVFSFGIMVMILYFGQKYYRSVYLGLGYYTQYEVTSSFKSSYENIGEVINNTTNNVLVVNHYVAVNNHFFIKNFYTHTYYYDLNFGGKNLLEVIKQNQIKYIIYNKSTSPDCVNRYNVDVEKSLDILYQKGVIKEIIVNPNREYPRLYQL